MNEKDLKELCRNIVRKSRTTAKEKEIIIAEAEARGYTLNKKCPNCYIDAAAYIYKQIPDEDPKETSAAYVLRPGLDVYFGSIRINEATITDELAEKVVKRGFDLRFFVKYPGK